MYSFLIVIRVLILHKDKQNKLGTNVTLFM